MEESQTPLDMESCGCDLCGSDASMPLPHYITRPHQVVICQRCGLMYTNPRSNRAATDEFYERSFKSDAGAAKRRGKNLKDSDFDKSVAAMTPMVESLLHSLGDPKGKRWLEIRCRSGAVAEILGRHGVEVHGVDPFPPNVAYARGRFGAERFYQASMHDLIGAAPGDFDAIGMVTVHVVAHASSPSKLLKDCYDRLKVGGRIIILDKDVTQPSQGNMKFALSGSGAIAHFQHLTLNSLREFVRKAGFEIEKAEETGRSSRLRHVIVIGRKPQAPIDSMTIRADDPRALRNRVVALYGRYLLHAPVRVIQRRIGRKRIKEIRRDVRLASHRTVKWLKTRWPGGGLLGGSRS
jgi:SAM-dependent methyltransferase